MREAAWRGGGGTEKFFASNLNICIISQHVPVLCAAQKRQRVAPLLLDARHLHTRLHLRRREIIQERKRRREVGGGGQQVGKQEAGVFKQCERWLSDAGMQKKRWKQGEEEVQLFIIVFLKFQTGFLGFVFFLQIEIWGLCVQPPSATLRWNASWLPLWLKLRSDFTRPEAGSSAWSSSQSLDWMERVCQWQF